MAQSGHSNRVHIPPRASATHFYRCDSRPYVRIATSTTPLANITTPTQLSADKRSCRKTTAKMATSMTLILSIGATPDAGPNFSA
jgi:hypothetical protein